MTGRLDRPGPAWLVAAAVALVAWVGPADAVDYAVRSLPLGCVFALMAVGLVLTHKTSGVLNLAFAAQAYVSAAVFYDLRARDGWAVLPAFVLAVGVVAPALGLAFERFLFRHLRSSTAVARLITSLGLLVAVPQVTQIWFGTGATYNPPSVFPDPNHIHRWREWSLDNNQIGTIVVTLVLVGGLVVLFRWTAVGLRMRAVVESPRLAQLHGVDADRISAGAWALSSLIAGLAGVLLAPLYVQVSQADYFTLLVAALAAAVFARLSSIGLALLGALLLSLTMAVLGGELPQGNLITQNLRPALPFVALMVLLVAWPGLSRRREAGDPLAGVDPPPPAPVANIRSPALTRLSRGLGVLVVVATTAAVVTGTTDAYWTRQLTTAVLLTICFLSITVISGMAGAVSLCQATFASVGAFTTAQVVTRLDTDVLSAVVVGTAAAGLVGALVALPALRLRGVYLTLVTLAFAVAYETVVVPAEWASGGTKTLRIPRPTVGPVDFEDDAAFFLLAVAFLAVAAGVVYLLREGTTGRFLDALRGSEPGATSVGIDPRRATFGAFAVSAAIAGLGGGLLVTHTGTAGQGTYQASFVSFLGLVWVVVVVTMGARSIQAAVVAAAAFVLMPEVLDSVGIDLRWATVGFGLGALTYARHPEGILEANASRMARRFARPEVPG